MLQSASRAVGRKNLADVVRTSQMSTVCMEVFMARRPTLLLVALVTLSAASTPPAKENGRDRPEADEVVCQKVEQTGSRLAVKRICMTRSQWSERRLQDRQAVEKVQTLQPVKGN